MGTGTANGRAMSVILAVPAFIAGAALGQLYTNTPIVVAVGVSVLGAMLASAGLSRAAELTAVSSSLCVGLGLTGGATGGREASAWLFVMVGSALASKLDGRWGRIAADAAALGCGTALALRQGATFSTMAQLLVISGFSGSLLWMSRLLGVVLGRRKDPNSAVYAILLGTGASQLVVGLDGKPRTLVAGLMVAASAAGVAKLAIRGSSVFVGERLRRVALVLAMLLVGSSTLMLATNRTREAAAPILYPQGNSPTTGTTPREPNTVGGGQELKECPGTAADQVRCYSGQLLSIHKTQGTAAMVASAEQTAKSREVFSYLCHAALVQAGWGIVDAKPLDLWPHAGAQCGGGLGRGLWLRALSVRDQRIFETGISKLCNNQRAAVAEILRADALDAFQQICPHTLGTMIGKYSLQGQVDTPIELETGVQGCLEMQSGTWMLAGATTDCMDGLFLYRFAMDGRDGPSPDVKSICAGLDLTAKSSCIQQAAAVQAANGPQTADDLLRWCDTFPAGDDGSCAKGLGAGFAVRAMFDTETIAGYCGGAGDLRGGCLLGAVHVLNSAGAERAQKLCAGLGAEERNRCENEAEARHRVGIAEIVGLGF